MCDSVKELDLLVWVRYPNGDTSIQRVMYCSTQEPTLEFLKSLTWWGSAEPVHFILDPVKHG